MTAQTNTNTHERKNNTQKTMYHHSKPIFFFQTNICKCVLVSECVRGGVEMLCGEMGAKLVLSFPANRSSFQLTTLALPPQSAFIMYLRLQQMHFSEKFWTNT